jgi:hypothetical protein
VNASTPALIATTRPGTYARVTTTQRAVSSSSSGVAASAGSVAIVRTSYHGREYGAASA